MRGRITAQRRPSCPGKDSRFTLGHKAGDTSRQLWVHVKHDGVDVPCDDAHETLVEFVNELKREEGQPDGGSFSINEHGQVVVHTWAPPGQEGSVQVIGVKQGAVFSYTTPITFDDGDLDPRALPEEGDRWPGPLCGISYTFSAPRNAKPPSHNFDEVTIEIDGSNHQLSRNRAIEPYPPKSGDLADFLARLRRQLPEGGRFRVNEQTRAFTANGSIFIGCVPLTEWFKPLTPLS